MDSPPPAQPLVLVHAWGESRRSFDRLIKLFPESIAPIAIELPGDPNTRLDGADYSVKGLAGFLATQLEIISLSSTGSPKPAVLGSSSGGYLAQQLAADYPDVLSALILVGSPISLRGKPVFSSEVEQLTDPVDVDWVRKSFGWFPLHQPVPASYIDDRVRDGAAIRAQVWRDTLVGLYEATPPLETGHILTPTFVISGGDDHLLGSAHHDLVEAIPNARGVVYEDTGHLVLWERPERLAADVTMFLKDIDQQV